jgi:hypothetical protein
VAKGDVPVPFFNPPIAELSLSPAADAWEDNRGRGVAEIWTNR